MLIEMRGDGFYPSSRFFVKLPCVGFGDGERQAISGKVCPVCAFATYGEPQSVGDLVVASGKSVFHRRRQRQRSDHRTDFAIEHCICEREHSCKEIFTRIFFFDPVCDQFCESGSL